MSTTQPTLLILVSLACAPVLARTHTTWYVDDDCVAPGIGTEEEPFCKIQDGIDATADGDTVLVAPGTYTGGGNRDISLFGKTITVLATDGPDVTTVDIQGGPTAIHRGFFLIHGETRETLVEGFTIKNGYLIGDTGGTGPGGGGGGGAFYIRNSSPTIRNCVIRDHISATLSPPFPVDGRGAGIYIDGNSSAVIENCVIADNVADRRGGGMYIGYDGSTVIVRNCLITGNSASNGGGIYNTFGNTTMINTMIVDNVVAFSGGGLNSENSDSFLRNCILWGNQTEAVGPQIAVSGRRILTIEYSNVRGGLKDVYGCCDWEISWGPGMIEADPLFFDSENRDFHLLHGSPCIDAGNNLAVPEDVTTDLDGGPRFIDDPDTPDTGNPDPDAPKLPIVDMGPYEYDPEDCNNNDTTDEQDIADGTSQDCNTNDIPDECEIDCNGTGQPDDCDIDQSISEDCNDNGVPDECEIDADSSAPGG
ncbi:MAG: right-handed parallel beta-helix repeat-containing protein, partial [Planctomycetes bacterium]|nr:right-handed parallel beta-helix repeat-containing protein [Planctomycetota bacterium]